MTEKYEDYWITAAYYTGIGEDREVWDEQIGSVVLKKDLSYEDMPFELEINGVTYKRED